MNVVNLWMVTSPKSVSGFIPSYRPYGWHSAQVQPYGWTSDTLRVINGGKATLHFSLDILAEWVYLLEDVRCIGNRI